MFELSPQVGATSTIRTRNPLIRRAMVFRLPGISGSAEVIGVYIWGVNRLPRLLRVTESTRIARKLHVE